MRNLIANSMDGLAFGEAVRPRLEPTVIPVVGSFVRPVLEPLDKICLRDIFLLLAVGEREARPHSPCQQSEKNEGYASIFHN